MPLHLRCGFSYDIVRLQPADVISRSFLFAPERNSAPDVATDSFKVRPDPQKKVHFVTVECTFFFRLNCGQIY